MSCTLDKNPRVNPFRNTTPRLTPRQKFRFICPGLVLFPLRCAMMASSLTTGFICAKIATAGLSTKQIEEGPLQGWRAIAQSGVAWSIRGFLFSVGFHNIKITGAPVEKNKELAPIIVCTHHAPWETAALYFFHRCTFVAAAANFKMPVVGTALRAIQQIRVDRADASSRSKTKQIILDRALHRTFGQVGVFPEGSTTNGNGVIAFKAGAFQPGLPIQPIVAKYTFDPISSVDPTWAGTTVGIGSVTFRLMCQWSNHLELRYLPVYNPSPEEKKNPFLYAENVRQLMAKELGVPCTDHSLEDMLLQIEAMKLKIGNSNDAVVEMEKVKRAFSFDRNDIKMFLQHYKKIEKFATEGTHRITYSEFLQGLSLPDSNLLREVFTELCSESERGKKKVTKERLDSAMDLKLQEKTIVVLEPAIKLDEFLNSCMAIVNIEGSEDNLHEIFLALDQGGDRKLSVDELKAALSLISPNVTVAEVRQFMSGFRTDTVSYSKKDEVDYIEFASFLRNNPLFLKVFSVMKRQGILKKVKNENRRRYCDMPTIKPIDEE